MTVEHVVLIVMKGLRCSKMSKELVDQSLCEGDNICCRLMVLSSPGPSLTLELNCCEAFALPGIVLEQSTLYGVQATESCKVPSAFEMRLM